MVTSFSRGSTVNPSKELYSYLHEGQIDLLQESWQKIRYHIWPILLFRKKIEVGSSANLFW